MKFQDVKFQGQFHVSHNDANEARLNNPARRHATAPGCRVRGFSSPTNIFAQSILSWFSSDMARRQKSSICAQFCLSWNPLVNELKSYFVVLDTSPWRRCVLGAYVRCVYLFYGYIPTSHHRWFSAGKLFLAWFCRMKMLFQAHFKAHMPRGQPNNCFNITPQTPQIHPRYPWGI